MRRRTCNVRASRRNKWWLGTYLFLKWLGLVSGRLLSAPDIGTGVVPTCERGGCSFLKNGDERCATGPESPKSTRNSNSSCAAGLAPCGAPGAPHPALSKAVGGLARGQRTAEGLSTGRVVVITGGAFVREDAAAPTRTRTTSTHASPSPGSHSRSSSSRSAWPEIKRVLKRCLARAGSGGLPGAAAGLLQVVTLMWLRTVVNYQCRYGTSMAAAASELYRQGGILRFYRGVSFALLSNPLSRFGMAAANEGAMALTDALPGKMSVTFTTWIASLLAGMWRVVLTPLDTCKTVLQVEGPKGFGLLMKKVWGGNLGCLYQGATAAAAATAVGYFPWFLTFNFLNTRLKKPAALAWMLLRNAGIGLAASISSDMCSNSIRVLKTTKQAAAAYDAKVTYRGAAALVIETDGWLGLLGRGLTTRILANGLQSMLFTVVWRYLHDKYVVPRREVAELREARDRGGDAIASKQNPRGKS